MIRSELLPSYVVCVREKERLYIIKTESVLIQTDSRFRRFRFRVNPDIMYIKIRPQTEL